MIHRTHNSALCSFAAAIATASKMQRINAVKRFKYDSRLDEYVDYTMNKVDAKPKKRVMKKRYEVVRNRDNKGEWLPEYEVYRVDRKHFDLVDRFESKELAEEFVGTL